MKKVAQLLAITAGISLVAYCVYAATGSDTSADVFADVPDKVKGIAVLVAGVGLGLIVLFTQASKYIFDPIRREINPPPTNPQTGKPEFENLFSEVRRTNTAIENVQDRLNGLDSRLNHDDIGTIQLRESINALTKRVDDLAVSVDRLARSRKAQ